MHYLLFFFDFPLRLGNSISFSTSNPRVPVPINLQPVAGQGNCTEKNNIKFFSRNLDFVINKSGNYVFEVPGQSIISVFNNSFNPDNPCDNYIGSNAYDKNGVPGGDFSGSIRLTLNLNSECQKYTLVLFTQSIANNTEIKISGPDGSLILIPELIHPDFYLTYIAVDSVNQVIKSIHPNASFTKLSPGTYKVYGLYYFNGSALLPNKIDIDELINKELTEILSYNSCFSISQNYKPLKVLPLCSRTIDIPDISGINQLCQGQPSTLTASGGVSYSWSTQEKTNSITVIPSATTTYTVTVTDTEGCSASKSITVTVRPKPVPNISGKESICYTSTLELDAGQGFTAYLWSDGGGSAQKATYPNLTSSKTFTVTVTDINGCQGTDNFVITVLPQVTPVITGHQNLCNGNAMTLATTTGYSSYSWSGGGGNQSTSVYNNVTPGSQYTVSVTDMAGCPGSNTVTIGNFIGLSVVLTPVNTSCGLNNGSLTASVGQQGPYTYRWNTPQTGSQITGLTAGTYTVTVSDTRGCSGSSSATIISSDRLTLSKDVTNTSCGENNGSARITATGGAGYQYLWDDENSSAFRQNMAPGTYTITVTATGGCSTTLSLIIEGSQGVSLTAATQNTSCGLANGSITVIATGGSGYSYHWSNSKTDATISGLQAGTYMVTVTDQSKCTAVLEDNILPSVPLSVVISGPDEICAGEVATIFAPEGLSYKWNTDATTASIQVPSGQYTITVTNQQNCTTVATKNIQEKVLPAPVIWGPDGVCGNKKATLSVQNGNLFIWSSGHTTNSIEVSAGTYVVTVTDLNGCSSSSSKTVALLPVPQVVISGPDALCAGGTGTISVPAGFTYMWSNAATVASINVSPGVHIVTVTNQQGCSSVVSKSIQTLSTPAPMILGPQGVCRNQSTILSVADGNTFMWSTGQTSKSITVFSGTYAVTVTEAGGCSSTATKTVADFLDPPVSINGAEGVCDGSLLPITASGGVSYRWNNGASAAQIQVVAGAYSVTATDGNGCTASATKNVKIFILPVAGIAGNTQTCPERLTTLTAHAGVSYRWNTQQTSQIIQAGPGTYTVTITDMNGCSEVASRSVTLYAPSAVTIDGNEGVCTGSLTRLTATGGVKYQWSNNNTNQSIDIPAGNYTVTITDKNNCTSIVSKNVISNPQPSVQSHTITFNAVSQNQTTFRWKSGNGVKRLLVAKAGSPVNGLPANGTQYFASSAFGQGSTIAPGEFVVYYGEQSEVTLSQLTANVTYYFRIYEASCQNNYLSSVTTGNPASQQVLCAPPAIPSQTISFLGVSTQQFTISWSNGNGSHRVVKLNTTNQFTTPAAG